MMGEFLASNFQAFVHRGNAKFFRENTIEAFKSAKEIGFNYLETDLRITKDDKIITFHDPSLLRTSGQNIQLTDINYKDLNRLSFYQPGHTPTFNELLEEFPTNFFNIDLKVSKIGLKVLKIIKDMKAEDRICIGSFHSSRLDEIQRTNSRVLTSMGIRDIIKIKFLNIPNKRSKIIQIPENWNGIKVFTKKLLQRSHSLGFKVHVWTVNKREEMQKFIDLGVDGLMTDKPELLKEVLLENSIAL